MGEASSLRETVRFLEGYKHTIEREVERRLARREPPPAVRLELVRRFRSFCRLASLDLEAARPSLDGLGGNDVDALERTIEVAVDVACLCGPPDDVASALRMLEAHFRTGIRRIMRPSAPERRQRRGRRRALHGGRRVRAAIDRIGDAYMAFDLESGAVADLNPAAEALLGMPAVTLVEKPFIDLVAPHAQSAFRQLEARLDADEQLPLAAIDLVQPGSDRPVPVEVSLTGHTVGGRRLAILVARERATTRAAAHADPADPMPREREETALRDRTRGSLASVVQALLGPSDDPFRSEGPA